MTVNPTWRRLTNAGAWFALTLVSRVSGFLRGILVARFLAPETASLGFIAISLSEGIRALGEMGTAQLIVTRREVDDAVLGSAWLVEILKFTAATLLLVIAAGVGGSLAPNFDESIVISAALITAFRVGTNPVLFVWEREQRMRAYLVATSVATVAGLLATTFLLVVFNTWLALPLGVATGSLTLVVYTNWVGVPVRTVFLARTSTVVDFARRGAPYVAAGVAAYVSNLGLDLVLALQGLSGSVGAYRLSAALAFAAIYVLPASLARASVSADAVHRPEAGRGQAAALNFGASLAALSTMVSIGCLSTAANWLYGPVWSGPVSDLIGPVCVFVGTRAVAAPFGGLLIARGAHRSENLVRLVESISGTFVFALLTSEGLPAAILASSCSYFLGLLVRGVLFAQFGSALGITSRSRRLLFFGLVWPLSFFLAVVAGTNLAWVLGAGAAVFLVTTSALELRRG
ncbi:MAG: oligosaccharide flippase family protein [Myxococcota bacterium]